MINTDLPERENEVQVPGYIRWGIGRLTKAETGPESAFYVDLLVLVTQSWVEGETGTGAFPVYSWF